MIKYSKFDETNTIVTILSNKNKRFDLKFLLISIFLSAISCIHKVLNLKKNLNNFFEKNKNCFLIKEHEIILEAIQKNISGISIIKNNSLEIKSFLSREKQENRISFNCIISKPFLHITCSEFDFYSAISYYYIENYTRLIKKYKIEKIILYDEYSIPSWTFTAAARRSAIKVFAIQHADIPSNHKEYQNFIKFGKEFLPDFIITYSSVEKNNLKNMFEKNIINSKIVPLGCSRFDNLNSLITKDELLKKYNLPKNKKNIIWMTQTHSLSKKENKLNCNNIFKFFLENKNKFNLLIKLHPGEKQERNIYDKYNKLFSNIATIFRGNENSYELVKLSDCIIIKDSSSFMIASILNKPILITNFLETRKYYTEYNFPFILREYGDLERFLKNIDTKKVVKTSEIFNSKIKKRYFKNFGNATEKIVNFIEKN